MLSVDDFRKKYPNSTPDQVALYGAALAAELARGPIPPEPDIPMPMITVPATEVIRGLRPLPEIGKGASATRITTCSAFMSTDINAGNVPTSPIPDLTTDIRRIVLGRRLTPRERAQAERPDMSGDDLLALLAGVPNAREWEALEGGD